MTTRCLIVDCPDECPFREQWIYNPETYHCRLYGGYYGACNDSEQFPDNCKLTILDEEK